MEYERINWRDGKEGDTPVSAHNLNIMDKGINDAMLDIGALQEVVRAFETRLLAMHPVGSIEINVTGTNPSEYIGGTWVAWGSGRVPVGVDASQSEFDTVEETGGNKSHTHTNPSTGSTALNINQIPSHSHSGYYEQMLGDIHFATTTQGVDKYGYNNKQAGYASTSAEGGGQGHTHSMGSTGEASTLQPYITCYMWKRTA